MKNPLVDRPWLLIVAALAVFVIMWTAFLMVAERNKPASIEVPRRAPPAP